LSVIERSVEAATTAQDWFDRASALEKTDADAALGAYEHALDADPSFLDAYINMGRLLHDRRVFGKALLVYRAAIEGCGSDPVLLYNLGVLLDDMGRGPEAMQAYEAALRGDPDMADCHFNLALLCEKLARPKEAIRHMARYRMLVGNREK
jgi:tetratricopeptide (TPR) repeat protein